MGVIALVAVSFCCLRFRQAPFLLKLFGSQQVPMWNRLWKHGFALSASAVQVAAAQRTQSCAWTSCSPGDETPAGLLPSPASKLPMQSMSSPHMSTIQQKILSRMKYQDTQAVKQSLESLCGDGPFLLGTACSGSDLAAVGLRLLLPQFGVNFKFQFNCENHDAKRAWAAREIVPQHHFIDVEDLHLERAPAAVTPARSDLLIAARVPDCTGFVYGFSCRHGSQLS